MKHNATQPSGSHDFLVCPSLARNSSIYQTNTTGLDNNVPHNKEPDKRENVWHKRTPVHTRANPHYISTQHMTYESHTAQIVPLHNRCQFPSADTDHRCQSTNQQRHKDLCPHNRKSRRNARSLGMIGLSKAWLTRERLQTEELWTTATRESLDKATLHTRTIAATLPTQYDNCTLFKPRIQNPRT